ncbi:hypothetical protein FBQ96_00030 [Nitrospirales bacterium NOB]|nr:hypothetical protein [Nitrospirales bacterium NOB]
MLFGIVVALSLAIILILAGSILGISELRAGRTERTLDGLKRIEDALIHFVAINGRLPCPANGALDTGIENPADPNPQNGVANCTTLVGTVPWQTLGISQDIALESWAQKISYRVSHGPTGLTRTGGASMSDCDSNQTGLGIPLPADGLCDPVNRDNTSEQFLSGKGLSFDDKGTTTSGVAFVLISHGPTGRGAYLPGGNQTALPNAANGPERGNATNDTLIPAQRTFFARGFSDPSVSPDDVNHFDDLTRFIRIDELARKAGRGPRDWPETTETVGFDETTTANMTTAGTNRFQATGVAGQVFTRGATPNVVTFGGAGGGLYSACLWWPQPFHIYDTVTSTAKSFRMSVDFEFPDLSGNPGGGMTVGFLPGSSAPTLSTCGTNTGTATEVLRDLGWGGGTYSTTERFAIEIDMSQQNDGFYLDPANNHVATDWYGTKHDGIVGPLCAGTDCSVSGVANWLRDGFPNYHRLRIEVDPRACAGGTAPRIRAWVMPHQICLDNPTECTNMRLQAPYPTAGFPIGTAFVETCITPPSSVDIYDSLYFGFTSAKDVGVAETILNLKQLAGGVY